MAFSAKALVIVRRKDAQIIVALNVLQDAETFVNRFVVIAAYQDVLPVVKILVKAIVIQPVS